MSFKYGNERSVKMAVDLTARKQDLAVGRDAEARGREPAAGLCVFSSPGMAGMSKR